MKKFLFLTIFVCLFTTNSFAFDIALGNKALGGGSQGGPGFVLVSEVQYFHGVAQDKDGNNVKGPDGDISSNVFVNSYVFEWTTPIEIFGAKYAMDVVVPFINVNVDSGNRVIANASGMLDLYFEPVILAWTTPQLDSKFILGINAPTGSAGLTFDHFSVAFTGAFSYYFNQDRTWQISLMPIVEIHGADQSTGLTQGADVAIKWGIGHTIRTHTFGIVGYSQMQITDDSHSVKYTAQNVAIPTKALINSGDEYVHAIGLQYNKFIPEIKSVFSALAHYEIAAANRDQGIRVHLALVKIF